MKDIGVLMHIGGKVAKHTHTHKTESGEKKGEEGEWEGETERNNCTLELFSHSHPSQD